MTTPAVTVLMSVCNGERYVGSAIESVLNQTFHSFELLVVDDGSTDGTGGLIRSYTDPRIRLETNSRNIGLTPSLNRGLKLAKGQYLARLDADDICEPDRLERQVAYLGANPDHVICGTSYTLIDEDGRAVRRKIKDFDDLAVRWISQFRTPIDHSTAMFRMAAVREHALYYNESYRTAQDFDYWLRLLAQGKARVLREPLVQYRMHDANITRSLKPSQKRNLYEIARANFRSAWPGLEPHNEGFDALLGMYHLEEPAQAETVRAAVRAMGALSEAFVESYSAPARTRRWITQQASGILAEAVLAKGRALTRPQTLVPYLLGTWNRLPSLAARLLDEWRRARLA